MKKDEKRHSEEKYSEKESAVLVEEKAMVIPKSVAKRNIDQTVKTPEKYISWYQYNTNSIDKYLTLCPHCKKPTLTAFNRAVVDSAVDYINGRRMFRQYSTKSGNLLSTIPFLLVIGTIVYFLFN